MLLFVYGTLMKDFGNNSFLKECHFLGTATTKDNFCMYFQSGIPFLNDKIELCNIHGELYLVDEKTLRKIDILEDNESWYTRKQKVVYNCGREKLAWIYICNTETGIIVEDGDFRLFHEEHCRNLMGKL